jgi:histidinol-phosphate/aromatic aminotransferase/cobyric acid decarboxylase-like protein
MKRTSTSAATPPLRWSIAIPNLLVTQTLSKSRSLAGLRVGLAVGHPELIEALERVKNSFNSYPLDRLAIAGAVAAFEDREHFERTRQAVIASRVELVGACKTSVSNVLPSAANFIFARHPRGTPPCWRLLARTRVIVRHFRQPRIEQFLRITVGDPTQNAALLAALPNSGGRVTHAAHELVAYTNRLLAVEKFQRLLPEWLAGAGPGGSAHANRRRHRLPGATGRGD